jgi:D-amino-acid dehydrogenase
MSTGRVVVVGGGVIGAASAYYLARAGWTVTLIDQGAFGQGCSHANCGFVCPSHVLPLAAPGAVRTALKALFTPNSPLAIKPRFDPALWGWLYRFLRRCNTEDMLAAGRAIQALLNSSRALYPTLLREEQIDCEWEARGMLFVLQTHHGMEHYAAVDHLMRDQFHVPAERIDGDALCAREPALKSGLAGGFFYETDAHLRPDRLMTGFEQVLKRHGVTIRTPCTLTGFGANGAQARAAVTSEEELAADAFVVATGAWTPLLNEHLGCRIPIQPGKGYSITMRRPERCPSYPLIFDEHRVAVTPLRSAYRLGSTMEFAGYDRTLNRRRLDLLREGARPYLHEPFGEPVEEEWFGWRPMTPDGMPVIGPSPRYGNVLIAAGHNMLGLAMAPATGKLVSELLDGRGTHIDAAPYRVERFSA